MDTNSIIGILILAGISVVIWIQIKPKPTQQPDQAIPLLSQQVNELTKQLNQQMEQTRQASERSSHSVFQQVQGFTQGMTQVHETIKNVHDSMKSVVSFQDIFKTPKLRGIWGEQLLENSLSQYFPKDMYEMQHYFKSGEAVDAAMKLPNGLLLPIDSKFNLENFKKMIEAEDSISKDSYRKQFLNDVKTKIDEIANKYILPGEGTTEYAMMYVPAEAVYYEMINNEKGVDIAAYARSKGVGIMSPNTFYLTMASIMHWFKNIEFNKQTRDIMKRLEKIATDGKKLEEEFSRLGKHLSNATSSYNDTEKRVSLLVDKVERVVEIGDAEVKAIEAPKE